MTTEQIIEKIESGEIELPPETILKANILNNKKCIEADKRGKEVEFMSILREDWMLIEDAEFLDGRIYRIKEPIQTPFDENDIDFLIGKAIKKEGSFPEIITGFTYDVLIDSLMIESKRNIWSAKYLMEDCLFRVNNKWLPCCKESIPEDRGGK